MIDITVKNLSTDEATSVISFRRLELALWDTCELLRGKSKHGDFEYEETYKEVDKLYEDFHKILEDREVKDLIWNR